MMRISLAFWTFFRILFNAPFSKKIEELYLRESKLLEPPAAAEVKEIAPPPAAPPATRSEALVFLALMQREGRLVDFLQESLETYTDAQIGAAVRDIHHDCSAVLEKVFGIQPLSDNPEGTAMTITPGFDPESYRLTGNVAGNPPYQGVLRHHGWLATRCDLPQWQGSDSAAKVIAPAEVEIP